MYRPLLLSFNIFLFCRLLSIFSMCVITPCHSFFSFSISLLSSVSLFCFLASLYGVEVWQAITLWLGTLARLSTHVPALICYPFPLIVVCWSLFDTFFLTYSLPPFPFCFFFSVLRPFIFLFCRLFLSSFSMCVNMTCLSFCVLLRSLFFLLPSSSFPQLGTPLPARCLLIFFHFPLLLLCPIFYLL